jgi:hypothetical protein
VAQTETDQVSIASLLDRLRVTPQDATTRRYDVAAAALCVAVLILALIVGHFHQVGGFGVETDFYGAYAVQAKNLLDGRSYTYPHHPPGYPFLLAAAATLFGDFFVAGKIISACAAAFFCWITYLLFTALFSPRIAFGTTILLLPAVFPFSFLAATDILGAALKSLPLWALLRRSVLTARACVLAGLFAGMAYLVRYDALFLVPGLGFALLVINLNRESLRPRLAKAGLFVCGALLVVSPWLIVNWRTHGSPFASTGYLLVATRFYLPGQQEQLNAALKERAPAAAIARLKVAAQFHSFFDVVSYDPPGFLRRYLGGLFRNAWRLASDGLQFPAYLFAPVGLALLLRHLPRTRQTYYCVCLLGYLFLGLVRYHTRFYLFLFPLGFLSVAYLFVEALPTAGPMRNIKVPVGWLLVLITATCLYVSAYRQVSNGIASEPRYLFGIAEFLRNRSSPGDIIIGRKPHLAYLAGLVNTFPFVESADAYLAEAQERGARYVVYSAYEARLWPGLESLRSPGAVPAGLKLIHYHPASETLIYEVDSRPQEAAEGVRIITGKEK